MIVCITGRCANGCLQLSVWSWVSATVYQAVKQRVETKLNTIGALTIMRYGAGPSGPLRTLAQYMIGSGATFG